MRPIKLIIIIIVFSQIFSDGRTLPVLAEGFNTVSPMIVQAWQKQTVIDKDTINKDKNLNVVGTENTNVVAQFIGQKRAGMAAFVLPKIERVVNIDKRAEELYRLKQKVQSNI